MCTLRNGTPTTRRIRLISLQMFSFSASATDLRAAVDAALGRALYSPDGFREFRNVFLDGLQKEAAFFSVLASVKKEVLEKRVTALRAKAEATPILRRFERFQSWIEVTAAASSFAGTSELHRSVSFKCC